METTSTSTGRPPGSSSLSGLNCCGRCTSGLELPLPCNICWMGGPAPGGITFDSRLARTWALLSGVDAATASAALATFSAPCPPDTYDSRRIRVWLAMVVGVGAPSGGAAPSGPAWATTTGGGGDWPGASSALLLGCSAGVLAPQPMSLPRDPKERPASGGAYKGGCRRLYVLTVYHWRKKGRPALRSQQAPTRVAADQPAKRKDAGIRRFGLRAPAASCA
mmetsp:Transcript_3586/g.9334  ORF Transcript_3586/g.9334 Transcript_3586/m.9334 type:complete len:221 (-) Transcript_3586:241-903(-)